MDVPADVQQRARPLDCQRQRRTSDTVIHASYNNNNNNNNAFVREQAPAETIARTNGGLMGYDDVGGLAAWEAPFKSVCQHMQGVRERAPETRRVRMHAIASHLTGMSSRGSQDQPP